MDVRLQHEGNVSRWQAVNLVFLKLFKEKLMQTTNGTESPHAQTPKELTTEALAMIVVMTIFAILSVLGSLSTAFEFLYKENFEEKKRRTNTHNKNLNKLFQNSKRKMSNSDVNNKACTNNMQKNFKQYTITSDCFRKSKSFIQCFCFIKNGKFLFQTDPSKMQFDCLHGIRVISNFSIICFHVGLMSLYTSDVEVKPFLKSPISKLLFNAYFAVDAFFVLSGFLNAYSFSREYDRNNGKICWWQFYLKRLIRLTPAYLLILGCYTTLLCYTGSGPIWPEYKINPVCKEKWWWYLFYINNFELSMQSCMLWYWHLAAEIQMYIISPIFLLSLHRWQSFGYGLASITIFLSSFTCFLLTKEFNLIYSSLVQFELYTGNLESFLDRIWVYTDTLYYKPYTRISPYLLGVLSGHYFYGKKCKDIRNRWATLWFGWIAAMILIWISFFALLQREESLIETALYNSVKHLFFSVGLCWIIFVCITEQGSLIY